jgi:hypothetical protein
MTTMSDLSFVVSFIIITLQVCMELQHFSSDLDNTRYRKSPRTKLHVNDCKFRERWHSESHVLRESRQPSLHRTICIWSWRGRQSNKPPFPSQTLVPLPSRTPTRLITPQLSATNNDAVPLKTNTNVFTNVSITVLSLHIATSPLAGLF